jgi:ATP-dependent DNA ligase
MAFERSSTSRAAIAYLVSRNGHTFRNFKALAEWIGDHLRVESAVLDGEIACVDDSGRSVFNDLLLRRRECVFFAFDLLFLNGEDLRALPLIERKPLLKQLLRRKQSPVLYVDHFEERGREFFQKVCELDLEGIVAKRKSAAYRATEKPSPYWIKIKNPKYSQAEGRDELVNPQPDGIPKCDHSEKKCGLSTNRLQRPSTVGILT